MVKRNETMAISQPGIPQFVDAHVHLYDNDAISYGVFRQRDPVFERLVGDYSSLPARFLLDDYLVATKSRNVEALIWHEFISDDPVKELTWAAELASASPVPIGLVGLVDFADAELEQRLDVYNTLPALKGIRQHLGWDKDDLLRRMASRGDYLNDPAWLKGIERLDELNLRCGLEVFGPQLAEIIPVIRAHQKIGFTIAVMGWPTDLSAEGFARWRSDMVALAQCENTCASISAIECIFDLNWNEKQIEPWIMSVIEAFGPSRCMFGSHLPIDALSHGFDRLYDAYERTTQAFSEDERDAMFRTTALKWYGVGA